MARVKPIPLQHHELVERLRTRFARKDGYVFLSEVRNGTGHRQATRTIDGLALQTWPSKTDAFELAGFEVKASRSDWLRELDEPTKAAAFRKFCHRWFLVVGSPKIVEDGELPAGGD